MSLLDLIFPKRCVVCGKSGEYICSNCFINLSFEVKSYCLVCNKPTFNNLTHPRCLNRYSINGCFSALTYNKTTQKIIFSFKYKPFLSDLKLILGDLMFESIIQNERFTNLLEINNWIIVPIPLSTWKIRKRGYNQAEILAKELAFRLKLPIYELLKRIKDTETQVGKSNIDRKLNIKGAFAPKTIDLNLKTMNILLVDDVVTTGATLLEAARILKKSGAKKVFGLTLARD